MIYRAVDPLNPVTTHQSVSRLWFIIISLLILSLLFFLQALVLGHIVPEIVDTILYLPYGQLCVLNDLIYRCLFCSWVYFRHYHTHQAHAMTRYCWVWMVSIALLGPIPLLVYLLVNLVETRSDWKYFFMGI